MLVAITTAGKLGLGLVAGAFIVFALLSSFYFPRRDPNFPGNRLGLFSLITVLLFIVTMAGVIVFAKEEEEAHGAEAAETQPAETGEEPATTGRSRPPPARSRPRRERSRPRPGRSPRRPVRSRPRSRRATLPPGRRSSRRRAAGAATRSRRRGRRERLGRTSMNRSPMQRSSSTGSRTAWARCRRSRISWTSSRSRTWPLMSSRPPRGRADSGSDTLSLARRGVRAAEGARLEIAYASKGVSRVQIPPSPLFFAVACLGIRRSGCQGAQVLKAAAFAAARASTRERFGAVLSDFESGSAAPLLSLTLPQPPVLLPGRAASARPRTREQRTRCQR